MKKTQKIILSIIGILLIIISLGSIYYMYLPDIEESKKQNEAMSIANISKETIIDEHNMPEIDWEELQKVNSDIIGWIFIEDTNINYPILQTNNNDYYLDHAFDKKYNVYGSVFMDFNNQKDFTDKITILYAHRSGNKDLMFSGLRHFIDKSFFDSHPNYYILTPEQNYKLEIFSSFTAKVAETENNYQQFFINDDEYMEHFFKIKSRSDFEREVSFENSQNIVALSTCTSAMNNFEEKYMVFAVLSEI